MPATLFTRLGVAGLIASPLAFALGLAVGCPSHLSAKPEQPAAQTTSSAIHEITSESQYNQIIADAKGPVLVDFHADWCPPCRALEPHLESFASAHANDVTVLSVDVDNNEALARRLNIDAIPALFVYRGGQIAASSVGYTDEAGLAALVARAH
jgi:thioredoxin 1